MSTKLILRSEELWLLEDALRRKNLSETARMGLRILQLLVKSGMTSRRVAHELGVSRMRITRTVKLVRLGGVSLVLQEEDRPVGHPPLPDELKARVIALGSMVPRPKLKEIAKQVGVSVGAVSELLNLKAS